MAAMQRKASASSRLEAQREPAHSFAAAAADVKLQAAAIVADAVCGSAVSKQSGRFHDVALQSHLDECLQNKQLK